jgi:hypothetical protein
VHASDSVDPPTGGAHDRLERALAAASASGEHESAAVCAAVEEVVAEAKGAGQPPERVLVTLKALSYGVLDRGRLPLDGARAAIAWVVRCAVRAYYPRA